MFISIISLILSILAFSFSIYSYWDNNYRIKNIITLGKDSKLIVVKNQPSILLNIAIINTGGKVGYIENIKINLKLKKNGTVFLDKDLFLKREFEGMFDESVNNYKFYEISPIVVIGKTFTTKKYLFTPNLRINQSEIVNNFDIEILISLKENNTWKEQKIYFSNKISNVWDDLNLTTHKNLLIELSEK